VKCQVFFLGWGDNQGTFGYFNLSYSKMAIDEMAVDEMAS
jgi:hypothetical protein